MSRRKACTYVIHGQTLRTFPQTCDRPAEVGTDRCWQHPTGEQVTYCTGCLTEWPCPDAQKGA